MSYFIKPIYPELMVSKPSKTFHAWLGDYKVVDEYDNWQISGDYYICMNAHLPPNAFTLSFRTFFASVNNIQLVWKNNYKQAYLQGSRDQAYVIAKYSFSFNIPVVNSSYFQDYIYYRRINFDFQPVFNNSILNDYTIDVSQNNLDNFINEITITKNSSGFDYINAYQLDDSTYDIELQLLNDKISKIHLDIPNFFNIDKPINNLIFFTKNDIEPIIIKNIKLKIQYKKPTDEQWNSYELDLQQQKIYEHSFQLSINKILYFDDNKNTLIETSDGSPGLYFLNQAYGYIDLSFDIEYHKKIRHFNMQRQFNYEQDKTIIIKQRIKTNAWNINFKLLNEVQNENIF